MIQESNQLLEYTIDKLLKTFNPNSKPIMKKSHFFKMMDLLDTRLQKQDININYPKYWYRYGSVAHCGLLNEIIPHGFSRYISEDNIVVPYPCRTSYAINNKSKTIINSTVNTLCGKFKFKNNYGRLLKKESYRLNSPYKFNTIFQDYFDAIESLKNPTSPRLLATNEILEPLLDNLLAEFPEEKYPELSDTHLAWDDTTRLVVDCINEPSQLYTYLIKLANLFWGTYSKAIRLDYNQHIPKDIIQEWEHQYLKEIFPTEEKIEQIRKEIILKFDFDIDADDELVEEILQKAHDLCV